MRKLLILIAMLCCANTMSAAVVDTVIVSHSNRYVGEYPSGQGVLYSSSLGVFIGHFENGIPNGICTHHKPSGSKYLGEFVDGEYCGHGRYFSQSGNVTAGDFKDGTANGIDTIYYKNGAIYIGECRNGKPNGEGATLSYEKYMITNASQSRRYSYQQGVFVNGKLSGGIKSYRDGFWQIVDGEKKLPAYGAGDSQLQLSNKYYFIKALCPRVPKEELTEEQQAFLRKITNRDI